MRRKRGKQFLSLGLALAMALPGAGVSSLQVNAQQVEEVSGTGSAIEDGNVLKFTMDDSGELSMNSESEELVDELLAAKLANSFDPDGEYSANVDTPFSWDNVNMYFVLTDRFENGDTSNDHSYGRSVKEKEASTYQSRTGTFHGGDLKGLTNKIEEGYFDALGTNAIWITAPYEQIHGALCSGKFKHYAYHGYYVLDYTNVDANMGTEADLEKFIDTAHEHGIRVVFDIVMNHAGYADAYTANEYRFGKLASNWEEIYFNWSETQYSWFNDYVGEAEKNGSTGLMDASGDWVTNWWGPGWIRAIGSRLGGYEGSESEGGDVMKCLDGLPDFKTETTNDPGIPGILKVKWTKEGNYDAKVAMTNASLKAAGLSPSVTGYISAWLSEWVRKYGVDGFRCDTAKHVEVSEWKKLHDACKVALKEWRAANPTKPGAQWTDDFWMTGECWGHGVGKDNYFTSGAFDSMINFDYQGNAGSKPETMEGTYASYAGKINGDPSFNVLSYISSHDTAGGSLTTVGDGGQSGISLLLLPGGVQTYYGDESGRSKWSEPSGCSGDQVVRSDMNWSNLDTDRLTVWQKVGRFRRNHIAVGAGAHNQIAASPYTFSRIYKGNATVGKDKVTDYEDKVVVSLPRTAGTYDVSVAGVFEDGTTLVDEYSGEQYDVSGGSVSVTCDAKGVILLAEPQEGSGPQTAKAKVAASVSKGSAPGGVYSDDQITVKVTAQNMTDTVYSVNGGAEKAFSDSAEITFGGDTAYKEKTTIDVKGKGTAESDHPGEAVTATFTYTRSDEPQVGVASTGLYIRVKKSDFTAAPQIYVYDGTHQAAAAYTGAWPGKTMTADGDYYVYSNEDITTKVKAIIFTADQSWRSTPDMKDPADISGSVELVKGASDGTFKEIVIASGDPCKVTVNYVDEATEKVLKSIYRVGLEGDAYQTYPSEIAGYELKTTPTNAKGKFAASETTVVYGYSSGGEVVEKDGKVIVKYEDADGNEISKSVTKTGKVGTAYDIAGESTITVGDKVYLLKSGQSNATGKYTEKGITVTFVYELSTDPVKQGSILIKYVNEAGEEIAPMGSKSGVVGTDYEVAAEDTIIYNQKTYKLASESPVKGTFEDVDGKMVVFTYKEEAAPEGQGSYVVKYVDADGNTIKDSKTVSGVIGDTYTVTVEKTIKAGTVTYQIRADQKAATGTYSKQTAEYTFVYEALQQVDVKKTGSVAVKFIDETGTELAEQQVQAGDVGEAYTTTAPATLTANGKNYQLAVTPKNAAGTYTESDIVVIYMYKEVTDTPGPAPEKQGTVVVKYLDMTGAEIADTERRTGKVGDAYQITASALLNYNGKTYQLKSDPGTAVGTYAEQDFTVVFLYEEAAEQVELGKVVIRFTDETGMDLKDRISMQGKVGESYTSTADGTITMGEKVYRLSVTPSNATGSYTSGTTEVVYVYKAESAAAGTGRVIVKYVDTAGKEIVQSRVMTGTVGTAYKTDMVSSLTIGNTTYVLSQNPGNAEGKYMSADIVVTYVYEVSSQPVQRGKVSVSYVDENGTELSAPLTLEGAVGDAYSVEVSPIIIANEQVYQLKNIPDNAAGVYTAGQITVICVYKSSVQKAENVGNVFVKYVNEDGEEISDAQMITGTVGEDYTTNAVPAIVGQSGTYLLKAKPRNASGKYTVADIFVIYIYTSAQQTSTNPGTNPGTDPGTNPGTDPGTDPGTNPGQTTGTVQIRYVNESGAELAQSKTLTGAVGTSYTATATPSLEVGGKKYVLKTTQGSPIGTYTAQTIVVTYVYADEQAAAANGTVIVRYKNQAGAEIAQAQTLTGTVGGAYNTNASQAVTFGGKSYQLLTKPSNAVGQFTAGTIEVVYTFAEVQQAPATEQPKQETPTTEGPVQIGDTKEDSTGKGIYKVTGAATVEFTVSADETASTVSVPATVSIGGKNYRVTAISDDAFAGSENLQTVTIGANVTSIGSSAFNDCKKLKKVTLNGSLESIGSEAFAGCTKLTAITIPGKVKKIGSKAFFNCSKLKKITIKTTRLNKKNVGGKAFKGIYAKATIKVPKSKLGAYKTMLKAKGVGKKAKIKK